MKFLISIFVTAVIVTPVLSADALLLQYCSVSDGNQTEYGKIHEEIEDRRISHIILKNGTLTEVASIDGGKDAGLTVVLYVYDGVIPVVNLEMKDVSYVDVLELACSQVGYVFWIENFTIHLVPKSKLTEHKDPKRRIIQRVIRK
ncbi:MAG: hypothetical protein AAF546_12950 [Verrucomicrobiota bacterium]